MTSLVSPSTLAKLEQLQLASRERLVGRFAGEHDSSRFGDSVDFADFREYHAGDDFRRIDYHVLARLDQLLIKLFEADDTITTRILLDTSASMATGRKLLMAKRLAAMLGFVALVGNDTVALHTMPSVAAPLRFNGRSGFPQLAAHLERLEAAGPTPFALAAGDVVGHGGLRGVTIVLSDLLTPDWASLVRLRADRSALVIVQILDESDRDLRFEGDVDLIDRETEERHPVTAGEDLAAAFRADVDYFLHQVQARCRSVGAAHLLVDADADPEDLLLSTWRSAGVVR